jgi:hypothetical protein
LPRTGARARSLLVIPATTAGDEPDEPDEPDKPDNLDAALSLDEVRALIVRLPDQRAGTARFVIAAARALTEHMPQVYATEAEKIIELAAAAVAGSGPVTQTQWWPEVTARQIQSIIDTIAADLTSAPEPFQIFSAFPRLEPASGTVDSRWDRTPAATAAVKYLPADLVWRLLLEHAHGLGPAEAALADGLAVDGIGLKKAIYAASLCRNPRVTPWITGQVVKLARTGRDLRPHWDVTGDLHLIERQLTEPGEREIAVSLCFCDKYSATTAITAAQLVTQTRLP